MRDVTTLDPCKSKTVRGGLILSVENYDTDPIPAGQWLKISVELVPINMNIIKYRSVPRIRAFIQTGPPPPLSIKLLTENLAIENKQILDLV